MECSKEIVKMGGKQARIEERWQSDKDWEEHYEPAQQSVQQSQRECVSVTQRCGRGLLKQDEQSHTVPSEWKKNSMLCSKGRNWEYRTSSTITPLPASFKLSLSLFSKLISPSLSAPFLPPLDQFILTCPRSLQPLWSDPFPVYCKRAHDRASAIGSLTPLIIVQSKAVCDKALSNPPAELHKTTNQNEQFDKVSNLQSFLLTPNVIYKSLFASSVLKWSLEV